MRAEVNENVSPGQPVEVLAAGAAPEVDFAVPEALIARVREGTRAAVVFDAIPGERFDAVVTEVGVTTTAVGTTFPVTVRLDAGAPEIRSGMAAAVDMVFEEEQASSRFDLPGTPWARTGRAGSSSWPRRPKTGSRSCGGGR